MIQAVVLIAGVIIGVALFTSSAVALAVVIWAQDIASAVRLISNSYYLLAGLMPIALWLALEMTHDNAGCRTAYSTPLRALLTTLQGALIGSLLGAGPVFLTIVNNLPVILADIESSEFGPAVRDEIIWSRLLLATGAAVLSAIPLGLWAYSAGDGRVDDHNH